MTTATLTTGPLTITGRVRRLAQDSGTMTLRGIAHWRRTPWLVIIDLLFPVMMLVMFGYFIGGGNVLPGGESYVDFLVPGTFVLTMAFGLESTMTTLTQDLDRGVLDRFRSMPIAPSSILVGRSLLDMLRSTVGLLVMIGAGLLVGWHWHGSIAAALAAIGLLLLLRFAMLWIGIAFGLVAGRPELVTAVQILIWPVVFMSNLFTSPGTMPSWLGAIADWSPMSATAGAIRELFGNPSWSSGSWAAEHAIELAVLWPLMLLALFAWLAVRRFGRLSR